MSFENFCALNQFLQVSLSKKDLKRAFDIIDRGQSGRLRLDEIKAVSSLIDQTLDDEEEENQLKLSEQERKHKNELDDLFEASKEKLEKKNSTFETIIFQQLHFMPNQFLNVKGIQQIFEKL